jgi:hypothetical protein
MTFDKTSAFDLDKFDGDQIQPEPPQTKTQVKQEDRPDVTYEDLEQWYDGLQQVDQIAYNWALAREALLDVRDAIYRHLH